MFVNKYRDGLFWPSLFSIDEKEKKRLLEKVKENTNYYTTQTLAVTMLEGSNLKLSQYRSDDLYIQTACEHVALKFTLCDTDLARDLLSEEDLVKANEVYARKQYNSKILQTLLQKFLYLLQNYRLIENLKNLFTISIIDEYRKLQEEDLIKVYGPLKKVVDHVASGIKKNCYYEATRGIIIFNASLNHSLNELLLEKVNYNFNKANTNQCGNGSSTLFCNSEQEVNNKILQLALLDDETFWEKHEVFNVITFINSAIEFNDIRHAEKLLMFMFENLKKMEHMDIIFEHGFPLWMSQYNELVEKLEEQAFRFCFKRLEHYCDLSKIKNVKLCPPMSKIKPSYIEIGQQVWEYFIRVYNYPDSYEVVERFLMNEVKRFVLKETSENNDIAVILDCSPFRYEADNMDRRLFEAYHLDCFSFENIWKRVYLKAYYVTLLSEDKQIQCAYLQRIFVDLIKMIEKRIKVCTVHQLDRTVRYKHFEELKNLLSKYGIEATNEHKEDYIISLLDRDTAVIDEVESFPVLEQIGDAIYGLAVAELLFYNPTTEKMAEKYERFTRAESQVFISKRLGFDKLYLQSGLPGKYVESDSLLFDYENAKEEYLKALNQEKYLADSLEMIIGSVYLDLGIEQALNFAKKLLLTTFKNKLHCETRLTKENMYNEDIDRDYWSRILPSPCSVMTSELRTLWNALNKVILVASLGTNEKEKRIFITNSFGDTAIYGEKDNYGVSWAFYDYLNNGILSVLNKYCDIIRKTYNNNK